MPQEGDQLAQRFQELVGVGARVRHEVRLFLCWQIVEAGAMEAKEHQDVVEGQVRDRIGVCRAAGLQFVSGAKAL